MDEKDNHTGVDLNIISKHVLLVSLKPIFFSFSDRKYNTLIHPLFQG